jgi:valyl-tRNA synthetase
MTAPWPEADEALTFVLEAGQMAVAMEAIKAVRNVRAEMNVPPSARPRMVIVAKDPGALAELVPYIEKLAGAGDVSLKTDRAGAEEKAVALVCGGCEVFIPLAELVDVEKERERLSKEARRLKSEIGRARAKLDNPGFVEKAPAAVVEAEREKTEKFGRMLETVRERLEALQG